ncbi:uncharacterized protein [Temnothorax nylanderi]|uniref:uncharacterized protein n=1 Tax=Temnothorax nylanderi TaxID=102681 RepID=UPI003A8662B1
MTTDPAKSIPAFYAGQSILLTGATGFLGKVFIEKVLRSCPVVREIFLLMRPKKGLSVNERLEKILNLPLFDKLREERPSNFEKLVPISGDVSEKGLGLSAADRQMLIERVTIIIHGAASVRFNDTLKYAIFINTRATRDICILAQSMKNIKALVYISTAFTHVNNPFIEEKAYPPIADWQKMIDMAESLDNHTLNIFTAKCLDYVPNTYIFSKNLAESVIQEYSSSLPCAIVRPSMVTSSIKEPVLGWLDNIYGPIGLYIGGGKGIIRVGCLSKYVHENVIPVDIVVKATLVVSWKLGLTSFSADSTLFVLNCINEKRTTFQYDTDILFSLKYELPLEGNIWTPNTLFTDNLILFYILTIFLHMLPAILIDLVLKFFGRQPMLVRLQRKLYVANCAMSYFSCNEWKFSNTNKLALMSSIPPDNRDMFSFDYSDCDWREYIKNSIIGAKTFLLHEDMNRLDAARSHSKRVYLFVTVVETIVSIGILRMIYKWIYSFAYFKSNKMTTDPAKSIPAFYAGQSIFLTGATGFLGKVFIEKVLRSCPDVCEIFMLMRPKKGLSVNERLEKILNLQLFDKLRKERPSNFEKLVPISGDVSEKGLGLSTVDRQILVERVTIVIHAAASVRFNDTLKYAIFVNTRATRDICILAQSMKNLKALVYVGTAFAHVNNPFIEEKVYPPIADWRKMIEIAESLDEHTLNIFSAKCLDCAPNTYIFSKNLAESVIQDYSSLLPCAIVRPPIVTSSIKEPVPGWIDNIYGPMGLYIGGGKGIIRVGCLNKYVRENAIPVDIVVRAMLVVSWKLELASFSADSNLLVLNCISEKYTTYQYDIKMLFGVLNEVPFEDTVWIPNTILTDNYIVFYILTILLHILPAILIDLVLKFSGRPPMLLRLMKKLYVANRAVSYFSFHEWKFSNTNKLALMSSIPPDNRDMFSFDDSYVDIREFCKNSIIGVKRFILHEDLNRLDVARLHSKRVYLFVTVVETIISIGILWIMFKWIYSYAL